jgi:hypothetical protein
MQKGGDDPLAIVYLSRRTARNSSNHNLSAGSEHERPTPNLERSRYHGLGRCRGNVIFQLLDNSCALMEGILLGKRLHYVHKLLAHRICSSSNGLFACDAPSPRNEVASIAFSLQAFCSTFATQTW